MPTEPLDYQALAHLKTALQAITVAGGYYYDVDADGVKLDPNQDVEALLLPSGPRPLILIEALPERREHFPCDEVKVTRPVNVHWAQLSTPTDDNSFELVAARGKADIEKAVRVDPSRGGIAMDTLIVQQDTKHEFAPLVWVVTEIELTLYRTNGAP